MNWKLGRLLSITALGCAMAHGTTVGVLGLT